MGIENQSPGDLAEQQRLTKLAQSFLAKGRLNQKPTREEQRAWDTLQKQETENRGLAYASAVPKKRYHEWSGKSPQTVANHARTYGIPVEGKTVDVRGVVRWIHQFFVKYKDRLPSLVADDFDPSGEFGDLRDKSLAKQIEVLERRVALLDMDIEDRKQELLPRAEVHETLSYIAHQLRSLGDIYAREFGNRAVDLLNQRLDDIEKFVRQRFDDTSDGDSSET